MTPDQSTTGTEFHLERYRYILQQLHAVNENLYRFLAIYQTLATTLAGAALLLFVSYRSWGIDPATARAGVVGLTLLVSVVAGFTVLLILVGVFNWIDYRREECELTDQAVRPGFRRPPRVRNFIRWYETYVIAFILASVAVMWGLVAGLVLPDIR
jgi:NADH:ubiquinone oxidoreductase subunit 6 (subunit J)